MSKTPRISIVITCYNYGRYLGDCLAGVFGQQVGADDLEIIAIDDCSTDDTWEILSSVRDSRLRLIRHEVNRGHVFSVNEGLAAARGEYVARIDPDDRYRPNFLAALLPYFERSPRVGLVYGDAAVIDPAGTVNAEGCDVVHGGREFIGNELVALLGQNFICAPTAIARREAWMKVHPCWDGLVFNDWYWNVMIARHYDYAFVPTVVADYRVHSENLHAHLARTRTEEPSIFRILDAVFSETESDPRLEQEKRAARGRVYGMQYLDMANKYFFNRHDDDAWRCYCSAFRHSPRLVLQAGALRRFVGLAMGRGRYDSLKRLVGKQC